ncbi:MAG TPA: helix-turn-helix domain-containing protein, partial [Thermomicrobiales bacterium]|nr:helix-turn-helix domain-containing protein [Thermomicrobiales bacterium]
MAEAPPSSFAEQLRRLREAAALTQDALAERAGLSRDAVAALEGGRRRFPHPHTVGALAAGLGLSEREAAALRAAVPKRSGQGAESPAARESALPAAATPLVGRQRELADLWRLLTTGEARLVTLTGPGGIGKTRLALETARRLEAAFAGVAFVALAAVADPGAVPSTIANALGAREADGLPLIEQTRQALRDRRMLLVLDNFEHLIDAAPSVAGFLAACPTLTALVTSRTPLRLYGEHDRPVSPLAVPASGQPAARAEVEAGSAVELFAARARAASPDFALTAANAGTVAAICRRLDGLPLAIELAAARTRVLLPAALLARLDKASLPLLAGGPRDLPERQRTMEAAIAWSHDLLDPDDRTLFRRLAVFAGGGPLPLIEALAEECEPGGGARALDGLERLVDRS